MNGIVSLRALARVLGFPRSHLEDLAANVDDHYKEWERTDPRTGKTRTIKKPSKELKAVQSRIAMRLFAATYGEEVQGGVRGKSPRTNAAKHLQQRCLVTVDVRKYFPSIRPALVYRMMRTEFGHGRHVAALLTRLVTYDRQVPQGAPTSTAIANAFLHLPVDGPVLAQANAAGNVYTRFIDDIALSGRNPRDLINLVARQLSKRHLAISRKAKLKIMPHSGPQEITGLLVNGKKPSVSKARRDKVRLAVHALRYLPEGYQRRKAMQSVLGRINYVKQYNPGSAARLERQVKAIAAAVKV